MEIDAIRDKGEEILGIATRHGARNVRVFGSLARREAGPVSDVDILVGLDLGGSLLDIVAIKQDLEDLLGCAVGVVTEAATATLTLLLSFALLHIIGYKMDIPLQRRNGIP